MSSVTRFGIVGLDHWYTAIPLAEQLAARSDTELVAIADEDLARATEVANNTGGPRVTTSALELIEDPSIDVIASFASVDKNPANCIAAAKNGKHIISIKPLARTLAEASDVVAAVHDAGVVFLPAESRARDSQVSKLLRDWIQAGRLGTITSASLSVSADLPSAWPGSDNPGWWADASKIPGGGWIDHSIYQIDLMRWLLDAQVNSVSGHTANLTHAALPFEDYGHAVMTFSNGTVATMEATWTSPGGWRSVTSLTGTKGAVNIDNLTGNVSILEPDGPFGGWTHFGMPAGAQKADGIDAMLSAINDRGNSVGSVEDAWENLAACLAFYESSSSGHAVSPEHLISVS